MVVCFGYYYNDRCRNQRDDLGISIVTACGSKKCSEEREALNRTPENNRGHYANGIDSKQIVKALPNG
jgi:hypothetical protein